MLRPHAPIVLVYSIPRVFGDSVIVLHTIDVQRERKMISTLESNLGVITANSPCR